MKSGEVKLRKHCAALTLTALLVFGLILAPGLSAAQEPPAQPPIDFAKVGAAQPGLLKQQISRLVPRKKGTPNIYVLGIAGWDSQDVFVKELEGAIQSLGRILPIEGRVVRLINHRSTLATAPMASPSNIVDAIGAIGKRMNSEEDVLVLFMTSHGTRWGFSLRLGDNYTELAPQALAEVLTQSRIRNRMVIVSACFSGIFVRPVANENSIVLTAADEFNTSFGCSSQRDWTYFGDAFFNMSLKPGDDVKFAFEKARQLIHGWELMDRFQASNPQGYFGPRLMERLQPVLEMKARATQ